MSRKTIMVFVAVIGAILGVFGTTFGLTLNPTAVAAGLAAVLVYVFFEAKADIARVVGQAARFKDPKFWLIVIAAVVSALGSAGVTLPISPEVITAILAAIVGILFKTKTVTT